MKSCSVWRGEYLLATPLDGVAVNVGDLSGFAAAAQPSGSKLPRHGGCLGWRHRERARSHRGLGVLQIVCSPPSGVCELAREEGGTFNIDAS
jgi:hypothetical protein